MESCTMERHYLTVLLRRAECRDLAEEASRELSKDLDSNSVRFKHSRSWLRVKEDRAKDLIRQAIAEDTWRASMDGEQTWWCSQKGGKLHLHRIGT